ncbi:MAG: PfkB family carbohydrate kinase [Rhizobiaceae bacterium]
MNAPFPQRIAGEGRRDVAGRPILCVGALIADLVMYMAKLPVTPGKHLPAGAQLVVAGMATSAATAVLRLGHPASLWASVGDDVIGSLLLGEMAREGLDMRHVRRVPGAMSAMSTILVDDRGERLVVPYYADELLTAPSALPPFADFGAVLVDVRWPRAAAIALRQARAFGVPAILDLDVGREEILRELLPLATHVVASIDGARIVTGHDEPGAAARAISAATHAAIVVTAGERGAVWMEHAGAPLGHCPAFEVAAVDTNAAGDVFHGAFAVGVAENMPFADVIRFSSAAAAIKCTRYGGRLGAPARAEVDAFLSEREILKARDDHELRPV